MLDDLPLSTDTRQLALAAMRCRPGAPRLSDEELRAHLTTLPGWAFADNRIEKTFSFGDFLTTMAFANAVAHIAHRQDHHPLLLVDVTRCRVGYTTHDAGGVTLNDCICAARIERLAA